MTCNLSSSVYNKSCLACMVRKIKMLRTSDKRLTVQLQKGVFEWMGDEMADLVKAQLRTEA